MPAATMTDASQLYAERADQYVRFVRGLGYPGGLRAIFRRHSTLGPDLSVLDAGCGTGIVTLALRDAMLERGHRPGRFDAFDLTQEMLDRFRQTLDERSIEGVRLAQANVLELHTLPDDWEGYDLVVSASMMEYLPRDELAAALGGLRARLKPGGALALFMTKKNWLMRGLIGKWWSAETYTQGELREAFRDAGFASVSFDRFRLHYSYLNLWGHVVVARL